MDAAFWARDPTYHRQPGILLSKVDLEKPSPELLQAVGTGLQHLPPSLLQQHAYPCSFNRPAGPGCEGGFGREHDDIPARTLHWSGTLRGDPAFGTLQGP